MNFPEKKIILVTGSNGQLGQEFRYIAALQDKYEFLFTTKETLDITRQNEVLHIFKKFRPDYCINCAAYTKVDLAETEVDLAFLINSKSVGHLVNACKLYTATLLHFSTDYVYDSSNNFPILETDPCTPRSVYGKSKRAGEMVLEKSDIAWICLRVSWLYSSFGHNFVKTMLKLGTARESVNVVDDQTGSPTYAADVAQAVLKIIDAGSSDSYNLCYNYCNTGKTNWAAFAREIFRQSDITCTVSGISTKEYDAPAPRPSWSVLSQIKIQNAYNIPIPDWKSSLSRCLDLLKNKPNMYI